MKEWIKHILMKTISNVAWYLFHRICDWSSY